MNLYVPDIGDCIKLSKDWIFYLQREHRNHLDLSVYGTGRKMQKDSFSFYKDYEDFNEVMIPKDSVLKVDRIYIRKGAAGFSSITFNLIEVSGKKVKAQRFWAPLRECNKIEFEFDQANKNVNIQWKHSSIFRGKEDMPRDIAGVSGVFNLNRDHMFFMNQHNVSHRYEKPIIMEGESNGEPLPYHIRDNVQVRPLTQEEKDAIKNSNFYSRPSFFGHFKKSDINEELESALKIVDWDLEIVDEKGDVVKTYKSLSSAKAWVKEALK